MLAPVYILNPPDKWKPLFGFLRMALPATAGPPLTCSVRCSEPLEVGKSSEDLPDGRWIMAAGYLPEGAACTFKVSPLSRPLAIFWKSA